MYRNVSATYELGFAPELPNGVVVNDNLFTGTDIKLPKDNPYLTPEQVAAIEKNKDDANWWRVYGEGLTGGVEGNVYPEYEVIDDMPETYTGRCLGLDFGFVNDPTAIVDIRMEGWDLYVCRLSRLGH